MTRPTPLSPWFVVTLLEEYASEPCRQRWFQDTEVEGEQWTDDRTHARLFNSIHTAIRVAAANGAYAVVVGDEEALKEYRPRGL